MKTVCGVIGLALFSLMACAQAAQHSGTAVPPKDEEDAVARAALARQKGIALLEHIRAEAGQLGPENQILIRTGIAELLWRWDPTQARDMLPDLTASLAALNLAAENSSDQDLFEKRQRTIALRRSLIEMLASHDPQAALEALTATRPTSFMNAMAEDQERSLELTLASRAAALNARLATEMAEKNVKSLSWELMNLMMVLDTRNPDTARQLAGKVYEELRSRNLSLDQQAMNFATNWLLSSLSPGLSARSVSQQSGSKEYLPRVADLVITAAMQPGTPSYVLSNLSNSIDQFEKIVPAKASQLRQKIESSLDERTRSQQAMFRLSRSNNIDQLLKNAAEAPSEAREVMYSQIAFSAAARGDLSRSRQIAAEKISDPAQRAQTLDGIMAAGAAQAASRGDATLARSLCGSISSQSRRAQALAQVASVVAGRNDKQAAAGMLEEALSLTQVSADSAAQLELQLRIAQGFAAAQPARAAQILTAIAQRVNDVLAAAVQCDGFVGMRSFSAGELRLEQGHLSSMLVQPFNHTLATLATEDPDSARTVADMLQAPEVRASAHLAIAQRLLAGQPSPRGVAMRPFVGPGMGTAFGTFVQYFASAASSWER